MNAQITPDIDTQAKAYARGELTKYLIDDGYKPTGFHTYTDATGLPIYWKVRLRHDTKGKTLRAFARNDGRIHSKTNQPYQGQFMPCEPSNAWQAIYPQGNGKKPLYRLRELSSNSCELVFIVEGEQKADALAKLGLIATTSGGSNSPSATDWQVLAGRKVRLWRDYDDAGAKYQNEVKTVLESLGCDVSVVDVDALGLPVKGDVIDWLAMRSEQGLATVASDILALQLVDRSVDTETPPNEETNDEETVIALATIEEALTLANDANNPDAGALWENDVLDALRLVIENSPKDWARIRYRLKKCRALKLSDLEAEILPKSDADQSQYISDVSVLIEIASGQCRFFHDEDLEAFAIITKNNTRQCWGLQSKSFNEWLSYEFYTSEGIAPSEVSLKAAINSLSGKAKFEGDLASVYVRIALHDGAYWLDLCNDAWQAVRITAQGWQVIDAPPVLFTRSNSMRPLPTPIAGKGNLSALWTVANIPEDDRLFIVAWLVECLRPETPFVILEISGEQGSAKSSTQSALRDLIDPNKSNLRAAPKNKDDIFVGAKNGHLVSYENLSHLSAEYQDALCSLATGAGYAGRTLYTNTDETVIELKKPVVLNGIPIVVTAQDLLDRTLHIDCPMLDNTVSEVELDTYWKANHAAAFTGLLDAFVAALAYMPQVDLDGEKLPRMADFTRLGEAVYSTHGKPSKTFINEYRERRKEGINRTLESSPIALAMINYLNRHPQGFTGTVGELLIALDDFREDGDTWVKSAKGLGDAIQRLKPAFRQIGILLHKDDKRSMHGYKCSLKKDTVIYPQSKNNSFQSTSSSSSTCEVHAKDEKQPKTGGNNPDYVHHELHEHANKFYMAGGIYKPDLSTNDDELDTGEI